MTARPLASRVARLVAAGAVLAAVAVAAGAFGAHALREAVEPERLATWQTAAQYGLAHALAAVLAGLFAHAGVPRAALAGGLFVAGSLLFSGSLYALVLFDMPALGAVTPLGGVAFIAGWLVLAGGAWTGPSQKRDEAQPRPSV